MAYKIEEIEGIGPVYGEKLKAAGVNKVGKLRSTQANTQLAVPSAAVCAKTCKASYLGLVLPPICWGLPATT